MDTKTATIIQFLWLIFTCFQNVLIADVVFLYLSEIAFVLFWHFLHFISDSTSHTLILIEINHGCLLFDIIM